MNKKNIFKEKEIVKVYDFNKDTLRFIEKSEDPEEDDCYIFEGYASTNSLDLDNEIIESEAWNETIKNGTTYPACFNHQTYDIPIGIIKIVKIDDKGLYVRGLLPKEDACVRDRIKPQMKVGSIKSMSIGGYATQGNYDDENKVYRITKMILREVSLVTFPANPEAKVDSFKSINSIKNYDFAADDAVWDGSSAEKRWRTYSKSEDAPSADYKNGFMYYDAEKKENYTAYKFLIVDIIDGTPKIVPKAIFTSASYVNRTYNKPIMSEDDLSKLKGLITRYYKLMDREAPEFKKYESIEDCYNDNIKSISDISDILKDNGFTNKEANIFISKFKTILVEEKKSLRNDADNSNDSNYHYNKQVKIDEFWSNLAKEIKEIK